MLVGLTGYAGSGKDSAAKELIASGWVRMAFADHLKRCLLTLNPIVDTAGGRLAGWIDQLGWEVAKRQNHEIRRLQQSLGDDVGRNLLDCNIWISCFEKQLHHNLECSNNVIVTDLRKPNEADFLRERGAKIIRIHKPGVEPSNGHSSDTSVDLITPDREIINNGTVEDLQNALKEALGLT